MKFGAPKASSHHPDIRLIDKKANIGCVSYCAGGIEVNLYWLYYLLPKQVIAPLSDSFLVAAMQNTVILQPLVVLVLWSFVIWIWMYATRIPAIFSMKIKMDPNAPRGTQMATLPPRVRWKADNFNHLMEQPTIFYALVLTLAFFKDSGVLSIYAAWAYVGLRVIHSLIQVLVNKIELRFAVFMLSNIPLAILAVNSAIAVF